eukprot:7384124-Prymnesium_polylepis.1
MFNGHGRGPKPTRWRHESRESFEQFFARRSEPLHEAEKETEPLLVEETGAGLKWLFSSVGEDEPTQVQAAVGAPVRSVVLGVTGAMVALGFGSEPGEGTCQEYWAVGELEVPEGTPHAARRVRGGTGDLQLRMADGALIWLAGRNCRPWLLSDDER